MEKMDNNIENSPEISQEQANEEYKKLFGVSPTSYGFTYNEILAALRNPEAERARLFEIARQDNRDDIDELYKR